MRYLLLLSLVIALSSCITIQAPQVKRVTNLQTEGLLTANPHLNFEIEMYNPNSIGLIVTDFRVSVKYGDLSLADIHTDTLQEISALSNFNVPLSFSPTQQQINNIVQSGLGIFAGGGNAKLTGTGTMQLRKFVFNKTFHFSF